MLRERQEGLFLNMRSSAILRPCVLVLRRSSVPILKNASTEDAPENIIGHVSCVLIIIFLPYMYYMYLMFNVIVFGFILCCYLYELLYSILFNKNKKSTEDA